MTKRNETSYYAVFLNIRGRKCVVVGGGQVALRKVNSLLAEGARVEVISPDLCAELEELAEGGKIEVLRRSYQPGDLKGSFMAIAATDSSDTNLAVSAEARREGALVNVVDDAEHSDFIVPSCLRRGDITVAVSTGGKSPALARKIRTRLEKELGEEYASLVHLVDEVRTVLRLEGFTVSSELWQEALDIEMLTDLLRKGDRERAKAALLAKLKAGTK